MKLNDVGKMATIITINVCATILAALVVLDGTIAAGIFLTSLGYIAGNGVLARGRKAPSTVLAPKLQDPRKLHISANDPDLGAFLVDLEDRILDQVTRAMISGARPDGK